MIRSMLTLAAISLLAAGAADAQSRGGGRGGGRPGGGRGESHSGAPAVPLTPVDQIEIVGVVTALDAATSRVTIAYEPVEALNWPKGTMPFPLANDELFKNLTVGEKVRFKVENHQIYNIQPY
jgi:Cu/Ag efflux protein CusF